MFFCAFPLRQSPYARDGDGDDACGNDGYSLSRPTFGHGRRLQPVPPANHLSADSWGVVVGAAVVLGLVAPSHASYCFGEDS